MTASTLAIVVPCFNEGAVIGGTIDRLREWFPSATIVVVDDGSTDDTMARAEAAAAVLPGVRTRRLAKNSGKGGAVAGAVPLVGDADHVLVVDADLTFSRDTMDGVVRGLENADVAIGNRRHPQSTYSVPVRLFGFLYRRHVFGWLFNVFVRVLLRLPHRDTQCGLKAFRAEAFRDVMQRLRTTGFAFDLDVLLLAHGLGLHVQEVPVALDVDSGRSSVRLVRDGLHAMAELGHLALRRAGGGYRRERLLSPARAGDSHHSNHRSTDSR